MVKVKIKTMDDIKKQIVERLRQANNILVTVRNDPTVDLLSACIGLSLVLDKMDKHAAAVFSGKVPSAMEFLKPEDTIEQTPDSLRDFIIALDKSKADKLRYKVEDTVVRIFITPYKTSLSQADLEFSQGDFNVDVVVALGAHEQQELDQAITVHGRILHDATIISVNNTPNGNLGALAWQEIGASSISEMVAELVADLQKDALDSQIATALLTGVVAETERFSNDKTTPRTMAVAGELMTAGANQQLVATSLQAAAQHANEVSAPVNDAPASNNDDSQPSGIAPIRVSDDGTLEIDHGKESPEEKSPLEAPEPKAQPAPKPEAEEEAVPAPEPSQVIKPQEQELPKIITTNRPMLPTPSPAQAATDGSSLRETPFTGEFEDAPAASRSYLVDRPEVHPAEAPTVPQPSAPTAMPASEPAMPLLQRDAPMMPPAQPAIPESPVVQPSVPQVDVPLPAPMAPMPPSMSAPAMPTMPSMPAPSTPPSSQTLSQIEESVHSPHVGTPAAPARDITAARDQVMDALASAGSRFEPLQSLNASPLGDGLHPHTDAVTIAPPSVPAASAPISVDADGNLVQQPHLASMPAIPQPSVNNQPTPPPFAMPQQSAAPAQQNIAPNSPPPVPPPMTPPSYF